MIISHSQLQEVLKAYGSPLAKGRATEKTNKTGAKGPEGPKKSGQPVIEDRLSLSAEAREIQRVKELARQAPDVRREKVEEVKGQIEAGTYKVSGEEIAEKLLSRLLVDELI
ncbi:MAG: flagellar biosynthesis anti-sigma factor FlgM [bacterium]|jgi:negative regulator of flagellin synthesis FlgM|nr:flagellar biosynthesis anti-sigma factor FlgM [Bacillota bacterium]